MTLNDGTKRPHFDFVYTGIIMEFSRCPRRVETQFRSISFVDTSSIVSGKFGTILMKLSMTTNELNLLCKTNY